METFLSSARQRARDAGVAESRTQRTSASFLPRIDAPVAAAAPSARSAGEQAQLEADLDALAADLGLKRNLGLGELLKPALVVPMPEPTLAVAQPDAGDSGKHEGR